MDAHFAIFVWIEDKPITGNVLKLTNVGEPRKALDEYCVGDRVTAKCPSYGNAPAVLGKIGGITDKKMLDGILNGSGFQDLLQTLKLIPITEKRTNSNTVTDQSELIPKRIKVASKPKDKVKAKDPLPSEKPGATSDSDHSDSDDEKWSVPQPPPLVKKEKCNIVPAPSPGGQDIGFLPRKGVAPDGASASATPNPDGNARLVSWDEFATLKLDVLELKKKVRRLQDKAVPQTVAVVHQAAPSMPVVAPAAAEPANDSMPGGPSEAAVGGHLASDLRLKISLAVDVPSAVKILAHLLFTVDELMNCSISGKPSHKATEGQARAGLDCQKFNLLESLVVEKFPLDTGVHRAIMDKLQNIQKVLRRKSQKNN